MNKNEQKKQRDIALYRLLANIYFLMATNFLFLLSIALPVVWLMITPHSLVDIIVVALLFPGLAALVSCTIKFKESKNSTDFKIFKHFVDGFRKNVKDTLKYCLFIGIVVFVFQFNLEIHGAQMPLWLGISMTVLLSLTTLITTYMMIVATKFQFKVGSLFRVAMYCLMMYLGKSLKLLLLYIAVFFAWPWVGMFVLLMIASTIVYFVVQIVHPVLADVHAVFVEPTPEQTSQP